MWKQSKSRHPQILWQVFPQAVAYLHFTHWEFFIFDKSFNRGKFRYLHVSLHTLENTVNSHKK